MRAVVQRQFVMLSSAEDNPAGCAYLVPLEKGRARRALKVNKEEIVTIWVALEHYLKRDHQKDWSEWEEQVRVIASSLAGSVHSTQAH